MTMQYGRMFGGRVSDKGERMLERIALEAAIRARQIDAASRRIAAERPMDAKWLVLSVASGQEWAVEKSLDEAGIEACVPTCKGPERRRRQTILPPSDKPVFNGYTLVRCVPTADALQALMSFNYVGSVVGGWERPLRLTDETISSFRQMACAGAYDWDAKVVDQSAAAVAAPDAVQVDHRTFGNGQMIRVNSGPFGGFCGPVIAFGGAGKGTPIVELDIFGRKTPIMIPLAMLSTS